MREQLEAWVEAHRDEIIAETQAILRIPSVEQDAKEAGAPFGRPIADALEHTLALCRRLGMATENFDGYAGHAEFGTGAQIVAMLGHLDVVPEGSAWTRDPWGAVIEDGWIFARGSSDDKGPTYAALFGAKAVLDVTRTAGVSLSRRIRLIFGCDEESGWQCMTHYFGAAGQPKPDLAFTPDAGFPLIYAEKGAFTGVAERVVERGDMGLVVDSFHAGLRPNMVPDEAVALLTGDAALQEAIVLALADTEGVYAEHSGDRLRVFARGVSAHGATPQNGVNAAVKLIQALAHLPHLATEERVWMEDLIGRALPDGDGVGLAGSDEITGPLTCNLGVVTKEAGAVRATFNIRYPATWASDHTTGRFREILEAAGWGIASFAHTPPLYVPQDQEPVRTLLRVYREQTGDLREPGTMGGRTYATVVAPNGVAFGAAMEGDPDVAHQADERFAVERLIQCAKIYAHALYELAK